MRIEIKAFGRKAKQSVMDLCGSLHLRADSEHDAEYLAALQRAIQYPNLMSILLSLGEAVIDKKLTEKERRAIADMVERVTKLPKALANAKGGAE